MIPATEGRKWATCITLSVLLAIAMVAGRKSAEASTITLATPAGLQPGDTFGYLFIARTPVQPDSTLIEYYDSIVNSELAGLGVEYNGTAITGSQAVVSTPTISVRQHIAITEGSNFRGVYNIAQLQVAETQTSNPGGLWSGSLMANPGATIDGENFSGPVYTGSLANGAASQYPMGGGIVNPSLLAVLCGSSDYYYNQFGSPAESVGEKGA